MKFRRGASSFCLRLLIELLGFRFSIFPLICNMVKACDINVDLDALKARMSHLKKQDAGNSIDSQPRKATSVLRNPNEDSSSDAVVNDPLVGDVRAYSTSLGELDSGPMMNPSMMSNPNLNKGNDYVTFRPAGVN